MAQNKIENEMEKIVSLAKRRGFIFPGSEIYGGLANSWDYGPLGVELKNNIKASWWNRFVHERGDMVGLDSGIILNQKVWSVSGHLSAGFADPLVECKKCHTRYRADHIDTTKPCENCGAKGMFTEPRMFNLMFKTFIGPAEDDASVAYLRPETAQGIFINFKNIIDTSRRRLPFGVAQIGKAFRNEITPGNFIFRTREFEQMEIEYFIKPPSDDSEWQESFESWRGELISWMRDEIGLDMDRVKELEIAREDLAHYSKRTIDLEFEYPFGRKELCGLAYRGDFDLKRHFADEPPYRDETAGEKFWPHVIEPSLGADRMMLAVLLSAYSEDGERVILKLKPRIAPYKAAIFPLLANKSQLVEKAREIYKNLIKHFPVAWDDRGNIGKRYYSQDEIGTPYCITVDFDTLGEGEAGARGTVTVRDRDTGKQERISIEKLPEFLHGKIYS